MSNSETAARTLNNVEKLNQQIERLDKVTLALSQLNSRLHGNDSSEVKCEVPKSSEICMAELLSNSANIIADRIDQTLSQIQDIEAVLYGN